MPIKKPAFRALASRDSVTFTVSLPPPLNNLFANVPGVGRVKTRRYRDWIKDAGWMLQAARIGHIAGPVKVDILLTNKARGDTDAYFKGLFDIAVLHGIIEDDSNKIVRSLTLNFADIDGARVTIARAA